VWLVPYLNCHDTVDRRHLDSALSQFQQLKDHLKYKYLLVMPWCGRNLDDIIDKECATIDIKKTIVALVKAVKLGCICKPELFTLFRCLSLPPLIGLTSTPRDEHLHRYLHR